MLNWRYDIFPNVICTTVICPNVICPNVICPNSNRKRHLPKRHLPKHSKTRHLPKEIMPIKQSKYFMKNTQFPHEKYTITQWKCASWCDNRVENWSVMNCTVLLNKKGKPNLVCPQNYEYFKNSTKRNTEYWRCVEYRRLGCSALAKTRIGLTQIINSPKHNHTSSIAKVNYLKIEKKMIDRAVDNPALSLMR